MLLYMSVNSKDQNGFESNATFLLPSNNDKRTILNFIASVCHIPNLTFFEF